MGEEGSYTAPGPRDMINYYGPVPTVRRFSYHDVISDERRIPKEAFKVGTFVPLVTPVLLGFLAGLVVRLILAPTGVFGNRRW